MPKNVWSYKTPKGKKRKTSKSCVEAVKTCGEYYVEWIIDHAIDNQGRLMYFLKWEGYAEDQNSWEYDQQLFDCSYAREAFERTINGSYPPKNSWEEFDNFCSYLKKVVTHSFEDNAILYKLSNKSITYSELNDEKKVSELKAKIETQAKEMFETSLEERQRNSVRLKALRIAQNVSKTLRIKENFGSIRDFVAFVDRRDQIDSKLKKWKNRINRIIEENGEGLPISVANDIDDEVPTFDRYICESVFDKQRFKNKSVSEKFVIYSCKCDDCYDERQECCSPVIGFPMAYTSRGVLSTSALNTNVIFECNYLCKCGPNCVNRVVQRGRQHKLELFRTDFRGWGVRSLQSIPRGAYVSSYEGEVVSLTEANQRPTTYLFDLGAGWDPSDNEYTYVIDANNYGNISRFVNHSCEPNCRVILVWIDSYDRLLPKVCIFTTRPIRPNEELTYDYGMQIINMADYNIIDSDTISTDSGNASNDTNSRTTEQQITTTTHCLTEEKVSKVTFKQIECRCGSEQCRKYLYS